MDGSLPYSELVRGQVEAAAAEADVILFVVDGKEGLTAADRDVADRLRRVAKPVLLVANKTESEYRRESAVEFYELGLGEPIAVSALHGTGVGDLMDIVADMLPETPDAEAVGDAVDRHRRPAERRQVDADERHPRRGARHRQRDAGHHARQHRHGLRIPGAIS